MRLIPPIAVCTFAASFLAFFLVSRAGGQSPPEYLENRFGAPSSNGGFSFTGVDSSGIFVGTAFNQPDAVYAGPAGSMQDISSTIGFNPSAEGVSDSGLIVGQFEPVHPGNLHVFVDTHGSITDLTATFGTSAPSNAAGINNSQTIPFSVAYTANNQSISHAAIWSNGQTTDLGALFSPGSASEALGINDLGDVVGEWWPQASGPGHAFLYSQGVFTDLRAALGNPSSSYAVGINDAGTVIGNRTVSNSASAFVYTGGAAYTLNNQMANFFEPIGNALSIDNAGDIIARGVGMSFDILKPVTQTPEPGAAALLVTGFVSVMAFRRPHRSKSRD